MKCSKCGNDVTGKFCENCGTRVEQEPVTVASVEEPVKKVKKPIYKKWWFLAIAIIIVVAILGNVFNGKSNNKDNTNSNSNEYSYSDISVGSLSISIPTYFNAKTVNNSSYEAFSEQEDAILDISYCDLGTISYDTLTNTEPDKIKSVFESENWFNNCGEITSTIFNNNTIKGIEYSFDATKNSCDCKVDCLLIPSDADNCLYCVRLIVDDNSEYSYFNDFNYVKNSIKINVSDTTSSSITTTTTTTTTTSATSTTAKTTKSELANGMRKDFKEAMDSYESFMDEYVEFMKKYQNNPSDLSLLSSYASYMSKYADMCSKFEKWENEDLNDTELAYYIDVQARVSKKLLTVA